MYKMQPMDHIEEINTLFKGLNVLAKFIKDKQNAILLEVEDESEISELIQTVNGFKTFLNDYTYGMEQEFKRAIKDFYENKELLDIDKYIVEILANIKSFLYSAFKIILESFDKLSSTEKQKVESGVQLVEEKMINLSEYI